MATNVTQPITKDELKTLIRETIREELRETWRELMPDIAAEIIQPRLDALAARLENEMHLLFMELEQALPDPDEGKEFTEEFAAELEAARKEALDPNRKLYSREEVKRELGLDE